MGTTATGFDTNTSYDWIIIQGGTYGGVFNTNNYRLDTTAFSGAVAGAGIFTLTVAGGNLHVIYTTTYVAPPPVPPSPVLSGTIAGAGTACATLSWSSTNGVSYDVQYITNIAQTNWLPLGTYAGTGANTTCQDTNGPWPQCFYRINAHH
jgi:hypothetical protein